MISVMQPLAIFYRLGMTFGMGYLCSYLIALDLAYFLQVFSAQSGIRLFGRLYCPDFLCLFCDWHLLYPKFKKAFGV